MIWAIDIATGITLVACGLHCGTAALPASLRTALSRRPVREDVKHPNSTTVPSASSEDDPGNVGAIPAWGLPHRRHLGPPGSRLATAWVQDVPVDDGVDHSPDPATTSGDASNPEPPQTVSLMVSNITALFAKTRVMARHTLEYAAA